MALKNPSGRTSARTMTQIAVAFGVVAFIAVGAMTFTQSRAKTVRAEQARAEEESKRLGREAQEKHRAYQAELNSRPKEESPVTEEPKKLTVSEAGILVGLKKGESIGKSGSPYPPAGEIHQMAATLAVDAGTTPDDVEFTSAFKEAFPSGYAEGRRARK